MCLNIHVKSVCVCMYIYIYIYILRDDPRTESSRRRDHEDANVLTSRAMWRFTKTAVLLRRRFWSPLAASTPRKFSSVQFREPGARRRIGMFQGSKRFSWVQLSSGSLAPDVAMARFKVVRKFNKPLINSRVSTIHPSIHPSIHPFTHSLVGAAASPGPGAGAAPLLRCARGGGGMREDWGRNRTAIAILLSRE